MRTFGNTLKSLRIREGMTQEELADCFNIPKRSIENWESGQRIPPTYVIELIKYKIYKEELNMLEKNKNGKYDVLNLSRGEWMEVTEEWLENVNLKGAQELRYTSGAKKSLEVVPYMGPSKYYESVHGSWARNY